MVYPLPLVRVLQLGLLGNPYKLLHGHCRLVCHVHELLEQLYMYVVQTLAQNSTSAVPNHSITGPIVTHNNKSTGSSASIAQVASFMSQTYQTF